MHLMLHNHQYSVTKLFCRKKLQRWGAHIHVVLIRTHIRVVELSDSVGRTNKH